MRKLRSLSPILMVLILVLVALSSSCDRRNPPTIIPSVTPPPPPPALRIITKAVASPDTIYADNNITFSKISITVKDGEGFAATNQIVQFKTDIGRILANVPTDSTGVAVSTFWSGGDIGRATIHAIVRNFAGGDSVVSADTVMVQVQIVSAPEISQVKLEGLPNEVLGPVQMIVMQSITFKARATNVLGNDVPNGTLITFSTSLGSFLDNENGVIGDSIIVATVNGRATVTYNAGSNAGTGVITARIANKFKSRDVVVNPGRPANIALRSYVRIDGTMVESDTSFVGSTNPIFMKASLTDLYSNKVASKPVKFTTNLGTFINTTQTVTLNTDLNGDALVRFTPGLSAGAATITALANGDTLSTSLIFNISSDDIHSIQFTQEDQITLAVANTGGQSSAILRVMLHDINGNLIDTPQNVYFKIMNLNPPAGANLNNQPAADSVLVVSSGGQAQISVNSGTSPGVLSVRASCTKNGKYVFAAKPNIVIESGPPHTIVPFIGGFNTGVNVGGGLWRIIAGAVVKDVWGNPVSRGTGVRFFLPNDTYNCQIGGSGFVGNVSVNGDSLAGVAYTILTYSGTYTNESLTIRVETIGGTASVFGQSTVILPLNDPRFEMQAQPSLLNFQDGPPAINTKEADIHAVLTDSQGNMIHDAKIMLVSDHGEFIYTPGTGNPPSDPPWLITTDWNGLAIGRIKCYRVEVVPPDPTGPGLRVVAITGRILGTAVFSETSINLYRYAGNTAPF